MSHLKLMNRILNNNDLAAVIAVISAPELFNIQTGTSTGTASKAEKKPRPPAWYDYAVALTKLLTGAWQEISREWSAKLLKALEAGDVAQASKLLKQTDSLGKELVNEVGPAIDKICVDLNKTSHKYWLDYRDEFFGVATKAEKLDLPKVGSKESLKDYPTGYQEYLAKAHADQIKMFVEAHPTRNIHPQIERQLEWIKQSDLTRAMDVLQLKERLERIHNTLRSERHWEGLSHSHVSRLWHHDGILLAEKNGVTVGQVSGPYDKRTCPVCQRLIGMEVSIPEAADHVRASAKIKDPDEYVKANPYPRLKDVDNKGRNELKKLGAQLLPPYHGRCRHEVVWLYADTGRGKKRGEKPGLLRKVARQAVVSYITQKALNKLISRELERIANRKPTIPRKPADIIDLEKARRRKVKPKTPILEEEPEFRIAAQPKTPDLKRRITKTKNVPILEEDAEQIAEGFYKQQDYVQMDYPAPFRKRSEAESWVLKNLANRVDFGEASLDRINATLGPLRVINQNMPLKSARLNIFQITKIEDSSGLFWSNTRKVQIADDVPCWFGTMNQKKAQYLERQQPFLDDINKMLARHNKAKPKETAALNTWKREGRSLNKLKAEREKIIEKIKSVTKRRGQFKNTVSSQWDANAGGTAVHEYAHAWHYEYDDELTKRFGLSWKQSLSDPVKQIKLERDLCKKFKVSDYAASDWAECVAENFSCYMLGEVRRMHPEMVRFFDQQLGKRLRFGMKLDSYRCYDDAPIKYSKTDPMPKLKPATKPKKTRGPP
jgi:hypothetical protein